MPFQKGHMGYFKGKLLSEDHKRKIRKSTLITMNKLEVKDKISKTMKRIWENQEYRKKQIKLILKGLLKRPTSLEKQMIEIIQKNNLPYKYVGDGSFLIGHKNPDFINVNGEKIAIEVFYRGQKERFSNGLERWKEERQDTFSEYGWKIIFLDETQVNEDFIKNKLTGGIQ